MSNLTAAEQARADAYNVLLQRRSDWWRDRTKALDTVLHDPTPENLAAFEALGGQASLVDVKAEEDAFADQLIQAAVDFHRGQRTMDSGEFLSVLTHAGRNAGPRMLYVLDHLGGIAPGEYLDIVPWVWSLAEFPGQAMSNSQWLALWGKAGFTIDGEIAPRPKQPLRLWRGAPRSHRRGMSWTDDRARAQWFADNRMDRDNRVWTALVEPRRLLARIHEVGRGENEWVINTRALTIEEAT